MDPDVVGRVRDASCGDNAHMEVERDPEGASRDIAIGPPSKVATTIGGELPTDQGRDIDGDNPRVSRDHGSPESVDVEERSADGRS